MRTRIIPNTDTLHALNSNDDNAGLLLRSGWLAKKIQPFIPTETIVGKKRWAIWYRLNKVLRRFKSSSGLLEVCDNESRWQWSRLESGTVVSDSHCRKLPTRREQSLNLCRIEFRLKFFSSSDNHCITAVIAMNLARTCYRSFQKNMKYYRYNFGSCCLSCNHLKKPLTTFAKKLHRRCLTES